MMTNPYDAKEVRVRDEAVDPAKELKAGRDQTVAVPKWDRFVAHQEATGGGSMSEALAKHRSPMWAGFAREVFSKLYGSSAEKQLAPEDRPQGSEWVDKLHETAAALPEWRALAEQAKRDQWACGVAAGEALKVLAEQVKPPTQDPQSIQDELDFVKSMMAEAGNKTSPNHLKRMGALGRQLQAAKEQIGQAVAHLDKSAASVRSALRAGAIKGREAIQEMADAVGGLGAGSGSGLASMVQAPPAEIRNALMRNEKLRKIAKLAGRMKAAAVRKQRDKARPGMEELCDVKAGNDLQRLLPSELGNLASEDTEALLYRKLMENSAMQYELRGKEHRAEGPIVLCIDESGSMIGLPDIWAKSVLFGLMEIAARQKRPVYLVHFDGKVTRTDVFENSGGCDLAKLTEAVMYFTGGGTCIGRALDLAAGLLEGRDGPWKRADVVLISDGMSDDDADQDQAIKRIKAKGGHLYFVGIGCPPSDLLAKESDEQVVLDSLDIKQGDASKVSAVFGF